MLVDYFYASSEIIRISPYTNYHKIIAYTSIFSITEIQLFIYLYSVSI